MIGTPRWLPSSGTRRNGNRNPLDSISLPKHTKSYPSDKRIYGENRTDDDDASDESNRANEYALWATFGHAHDQPKEADNK